jgi:hypothetical protein
MTTVFELVAGSIVLGWLFHQIPARKRLERHLYLSYGFGLFFCAGSILLGLEFGGLWIATLEPFGVMLPALCLRSSARKVGWQDEAVPSVDKLVLAGLMSVVIAGSFGVLPVFPYGWFYAGIGPAALAVGLALWALWRRQIVVLIAVTLGQVLWLLDVGSSNFYDHVAHLVLIPALVISALIPRR